MLKLKKLKLRNQRKSKFITKKQRILQLKFAVKLVLPILSKIHKQLFLNNLKQSRSLSQNLNLSQKQSQSLRKLSLNLLSQQNHLKLKMMLLPLQLLLLRQRLKTKLSYEYAQIKHLIWAF